MKYPKKEQEEAEVILRRFLKPGTIVYTVLRSVSRSGMSRCIDLYTFQDDRKVYLTGFAACYMGWSLHKGVVKVNGCGMDMGFHLVNNLSSRLFCNKDGSYSHEGAYALKHEWI